MASCFGFIGTTFTHWAIYVNRVQCYNLGVNLAISLQVTVLRHPEFTPNNIKKWVPHDHFVSYTPISVELNTDKYLTVFVA